MRFNNAAKNNNNNNDDSDGGGGNNVQITFLIHISQCKKYRNDTNILLQFVLIKCHMRPKKAQTNSCII